MNSLDKKIRSGLDFHKIFQEAASSSTSKIITFVNPFSYEKLKISNHLIPELDYIFSDGSLLCFFNNLFKKRKITRASFDYSSIAKEVLLFAEIKKKKVAIIGATKRELDLAVKALTLRHKDLNIVFTRNGYFNNRKEKKETLSKISTSKANLVIVGMGTPFQEEFSILIKENIPGRLLILTCGGFLSQTSKSINYYHPFLNKLGLRWLQRAFLHKHVRKRIIKYYPRFVFNYIRSNIFNN
tara:strand:+ start:842 stop:1564 length:723 start_codon:yes stop_codon:yes gene_type:complete